MRHCPNQRVGLAPSHNTIGKSRPGCGASGRRAENPAVTDPARPLLCVFAHGVGAAELARLQADLPALAAAPATPLAGAIDLAADGLGPLDATDRLRDAGVAVDRSAVVLRPAHRSDRTAIDLLAQRPTGPAPVTLFAAGDLPLLAAREGVRGLRVGLAQLGDDLRRLGLVLRRGEAPELWLIGLGSLVPVRASFDFAAAFGRHLPPPLGRDLQLHVAAGAARVVAANRRALVLAARALARPPFAAHVAVGAGAAGTLRCLARPGVAFGRRPVVARTARSDEAAPVAALPVPHHASEPLDVAGVMARFWLRAAALHAPTVAPLPQPAPDRAVASGELPITAAPAATADADRAALLAERDPPPLA